MTEGNFAKLEGRIVNLTAKDVVIVREPSWLSGRLPVCRETKVLKVPNDTQVAHRSAENVMPHVDGRLAVSGKTEKVGVLNDVFDLVRPLESCEKLKEFWRQAVQEFCARVDVSPTRVLRALSRGSRLEEFGGLSREGMVVVNELSKGNQKEYYGVVSRGVALLAHYHREDISHLLVPAMPVKLDEAMRERLKVGPEVSEGYQALMPAMYLAR